MLNVFDSEHYLLNNITCFIWAERHLKLEVLKGEKRRTQSNWFKDVSTTLYLFNLVTKMYILDIYVREKKSQNVKKKNSL